MTTSVTLAANQGVLYRGALLGKLTEGGTYKLVDSSASDGSKVASVVLAVPKVDTSTDDLTVLAYKTGVYNYDALYVAAGDTVEDHEEELRRVNIHFKTDYKGV
nr:head decoration protein [Paenibacillus roseus]